MTFKKIITSWSVIFTLLFVVLSLILINPQPWNEGVSITSVQQDSSAFISGISNPLNVKPMNLEKILYINDIPIKDVNDYYEITANLQNNQTIVIKTNKDIYRLRTQPLTETEYLDEFENVTVEKIIEVNETIDNETVVVEKLVNQTVEQQKTIEHVIGVKSLGLGVINAPTNNLRKGLDLAGGTRVLLQPERKLDTSDMDLTLSNLKQRLNVFGLSDIIVRETSDLSGNQYIMVEIPGANEDQVRDLLSNQGKFEAKIGDDLVFTGGIDITYVCRSGTCAGVRSCHRLQNGEYTCRFQFSIALTREAAERQADITRGLSIVSSEQGSYLSEKLYLYLDDELVDELNIGSDLRGHVTTDIAISGSGAGATEYDAAVNAADNMKRLQTILVTGSLPAKLDIVKTDNVSPILGEEFLKNAVWMIILVILSVGLFVTLRYRNFKIAIPMACMMLSEVIILLGFAVLANWYLDLAAIAGIIVAVGTGVDDQIIITDESMKKENSNVNWKERIKRAFFIVMGAYFTTVVAMIPLWFAGAGLVKGFALTSIVGVSVGVIFTRRAYAKIIEPLIE